MKGSAELLQLAHLLRIGAGAALEIDGLRRKDTAAIERLANQAVEIADELEAIAASVRRGSGAGSVGPEP